MRGKDLRKNVLNIVERRWPVHIKELVRELDLEVNNSNIKKISYHIKQLENAEKVRTKRLGKALIAWPHDMEKLRVIYELIMKSE
jgi:predicted transcriptional regulator